MPPETTFLGGTARDRQVSRPGFARLWPTSFLGLMPSQICRREKKMFVDKAVDAVFSRLEPVSRGILCQLVTQGACYKTAKAFDSVRKSKPKQRVFFVLCGGWRVCCSELIIELYGACCALLWCFIALRFSSGIKTNPSFVCVFYRGDTLPLKRVKTVCANVERAIQTSSRSALIQDMRRNPFS